MKVVDENGKLLSRHKRAPVEGIKAKRCRKKVADMTLQEQLENSEAAALAYKNNPKYRASQIATAGQRQMTKSEFINSKKTPCHHCKSFDRDDLTAHHIDPTQKKYEISKMGTYSLETIEEELAKCCWLCNKCHINFHRGKIALFGRYIATKANGKRMWKMKPRYDKNGAPLLTEQGNQRYSREEILLDAAL